MIHRSSFFDNFGQVVSKYPDVDFSDMFSKGQMDSKRWLVDSLIEINIDLGTIFLCAGWYGSLATFLFESGLSIEKIRSFDIDPSCAGVADTFNRSWTMDNWRFKASTLDICNMTFPLNYSTNRASGTSCELTDMPDTIINTSCEHINNFSDWYSSLPVNTLLVMQSNDFFEIDEHVNCSKDLNDFDRLVPMSRVLYLDELELPKYSRFMKIGYK